MPQCWARVHRGGGVAEVCTVLVVKLVMLLYVLTHSRAEWPLHLYPPNSHAPAGVEGWTHYGLPPWPRQPRAPCPTLPHTTPYYFYITVLVAPRSPA